MSANSSIEWTDRTWNPVRGCSVISPGCVHCYAMKQAHRFGGEGKPYAGLTKQTKTGPQWTGAIRTVESALLEPLSWRKPARVFVNSMSDLFHEGVPEDFIAEVFGVIAVAGQKFQGKGDGYTINGDWTDSGGKRHPVKWPNQKHGPHTFQVLTKRPERMHRSDKVRAIGCIRRDSWSPRPRSTTRRAIAWRVQRRITTVRANGSTLRRRAPYDDQTHDPRRRQGRK